MDPLTGFAIASVAAPVVGGIMGNIMSQGDKQRAEAAMRAALAQYDNINIPDSEKMKLALQSPEVQGILQPYLEQAQQIAGTSMEGINIDPRLKQAQMDALETMSKMGAEGLTAEDRMQLNAARRQIAGDEQARQAQILQSMAERGIGGSGLELAAKLSSSQSAADKGSQESDRLMAMAQNRMLNAVSQAGGLGGQMRSQEFGEQSDVARAKDAIAQFNASQSAAAQARNIAAQNQAQARNLSEKQRIADVGVGTANFQQQYNKELAQRDFDNRMALASARANALAGQANQYQQQAGQAAQMWAGMGSGVGQGLMGAAMLQGRYGGAKPTPTIQPIAGGGGMAPTAELGGGPGVRAVAFAHGGIVPGKAALPDNDERNDIISAKLSPGEIVIPRSHAQSPDLAKAYIDHLVKVSKGEA